MTRPDGTSPTARPGDGRTAMPSVWRGRRRWMLAALVACGALQAALGLAMAQLVNAVLGAASTIPGGWSAHAGELTLLLACVLGIGAARWLERVIAEALGQNYVFEQRRRLIASALLGTRGNPSLGVVVTRASNDLTAVRNWISQGIVPLFTGLPLIGIIVGVLAASNLPVAIAVGAPLVVAAAVLPTLSAVAHERARRLRRYRGGMSAHIADTVRAGESVRVAGAVRRELNAVDRNSAKVVSAAVARARVTGGIRSLTVTAASLGTAGVVLVAAIGVIDASQVAAAMTLIGVMATPLADLGRAIEYRQNYRAARRILAPLLDEARELRRVERDREREWREGDGVAVPGHRGLSVRRRGDEPSAIPELDAKPGDRVLLQSARPDRTRHALRVLLGIDVGAADDPKRPLVVIDGVDYARAPGKQRRRLVGFASGRVRLERGSVGRLVGYRSPDADVRDLSSALQSVGLGDRLASSPDGLDTKLKNDGAPWSPSDTAKVKLARALLEAPPLLVVEDLDEHLDDDGLERLRRVFAEYPGVVLYSSQRPERLCASPTVWRLGEAVRETHDAVDDDGFDDDE